MIIMYIPIILAILYNIKIIKDKNDNINVLNKQNTNSIKGLIALTVILHHLSQRIEGQSLFLLRGIGYLIVGLFLFYSGYGMARATINKNDYLDTFWKSRVPKVIIPFMMANVLFIIGYSIFENKTYTITQIICYLIGIELIDSFKWYIWTTVILYIGFYISFKYFKNKKSIIAMFIYINMYYWTCYTFKVSGWWYNSVFSFFVGVIFGMYSKSIIKFVQNNYKYTLIPVTVFLLIYTYGFKHGNIFTATIANVSFVISFILISIKVRIGNKFCTFLGGISYEIYLVHRLVLDILEYRIDNKYVYIALSLITSILLAYIFSKLVNVTINLIELNKKRKIIITRRGTNEENSSASTMLQ